MGARTLFRTRILQLEQVCHVGRKMAIQDRARRGAHFGVCVRGELNDQLDRPRRLHERSGRVVRELPIGVGRRHDRDSSLEELGKRFEGHKHNAILVVVEKACKGGDSSVVHDMFDLIERAAGNDVCNSPCGFVAHRVVVLAHDGQERFNGVDLEHRGELLRRSGRDIGQRPARLLPRVQNRGSSKASEPSECAGCKHHLRLIGTPRQQIAHCFESGCRDGALRVYQKVRQHVDHVTLQHRVNPARSIVSAVVREVRQRPGRVRYKFIIARSAEVCQYGDRCPNSFQLWFRTATAEVGHGPGSRPEHLPRHSLRRRKHGEERGQDAVL
eukprot:m.238676 g.238676  ORF g.238676 m.238676 type:complete len:328 (-) comp26238_c0_seq4:1627-2610(-)